MKRLFLALRAELNDYDNIQVEKNLHARVCFFGDAYSKVFKDRLNSYKNKTLGTLNTRFELIRFES